MAAQKKKSFAADLNPVMQFISVPEEEATPTPKTFIVSPRESTTQGQTFTVSPRESTTQGQMFERVTTTEAITTPDENGEQIRFVYATPDKERKSRRVQLLMRPSLYDSIKAEAEAHGASVNDYIDAILSFHIGGQK